MRELATQILEAGGGQRPLVVAITGPVAVGKTWLSTEVAADLLELVGGGIQTVSTDGFLFPNSVLHEKRLDLRKGYPESYDWPAFTRFLLAVRAGEPEAFAPRYSHDYYDIMRRERLIVRRPHILLLEGLHLLREEIRALVDVGVYVDADLAAVEEWYVARLVGLCAASANDPKSFYSHWAGMDPAAIDAFARQAWTKINLPNVVDYIAPTKVLADIVVELGADHSVVAITARGRSG